MLLRKGVYSYIYMDEWEKLNETSLPGNLNMEDVTDSDYMHAKRGCGNFEKKNQMNIMICILKMIHYLYLMLLKILEKCVKKVMV